MERRIPIGFALLATKCSSTLIPLERLDSKDNHRPAQCRQPDRSLNSSDTIVTRWMRADKRSCIAGQIIVAAAISLRNLVPAHVGRQASNADKAWEPRTFHPCVFIYIYILFPTSSYYRIFRTALLVDRSLSSCQSINYIKFISNSHLITYYRFTQ